ncbi:MAG: PQQ-binding-like beta-propeller repeat protein, partial [Planctomycetota bacterium]
SMADGSLPWKTLENGKSQSPGAFSSPTIATLQGKRQLLVQTRLAMNGVDLDSGEVLWSRPINSFRGMNILTALPIGDRVFTSAHSGKAQMFDIGLDGSKWTAEEAWSQKQQGYMSSPVLVDGKIFMHLKNERMTMIDPETGKAFYTTSPVGKYASMVTDGSRVLALTNKGMLMLIDGTVEEFKVLSEQQVANDSWAHLAIAGENVVIRDLNALKVFKIKR